MSLSSCNLPTTTSSSYSSRMPTELSPGPVTPNLGIDTSPAKTASNTSPKPPPETIESVLNDLATTKAASRANFSPDLLQAYSEALLEDFGLHFLPQPNQHLLLYNELMRRFCCYAKKVFFSSLTRRLRWDGWLLWRS
ncbi:hypothetical protein BJ508DRAFT_363475 [Ascobolus immersus RN42]|uniref:Uncharacterized protein n=1 Tax=Ascobolus immersus RN42 TaxID=1160509 RepID=A0A3N4HYR4_ASCIM|nr:hypothetical protein BJ508DRAFT_363475 [Ascobolus immersus RN42]